MALPTTPLMARKRLLGAVEEVTSGTSLLSTVTTVLADTVIYDAKFVPLDIFADGERRPNWLKLGRIDSIKTGQLAKFASKSSAVTVAALVMESMNELSWNALCAYSGPLGAVSVNCAVDVVPGAMAGTANMRAVVPPW